MKRLREPCATRTLGSNEDKLGWKYLSRIQYGNGLLVIAVYRLAFPLVNKFIPLLSMED